jgi:hypothetical protein
VPTSWQQRGEASGESLLHANPSDLFDSTANLSAGWSSLAIGTAYLVSLYSENPTTSSYAAFLGSWMAALLSYNGGANEKYAAEVFAYVPNYDSVKSTSIF